MTTLHLMENLCWLSDIFSASTCPLSIRLFFQFLVLFVTWAVLQLLVQVRPLSSRTKWSGQEHLNVVLEPSGTSRQRCEHPPLLFAHGLGTVEESNASHQMANLRVKHSILGWKRTAAQKANMLLLSQKNTHSLVVCWGGKCANHRAEGPGKQWWLCQCHSSWW